MRTYRIAVLPGDGVGPEVVNITVKVLEVLQKRAGTYKIDLVCGEAGANAIAKY